MKIKAILLITALILILLTGCTSSSYNRKYPVHAAIYKNDITQLKSALDTGVSANTPDQHGSLPLHVAISHNNIGMARLLISRGADINGRDQSGETPLFTAAYTCRPSLIDFFANSDADPTVRNNQQMTAYQTAVSYYCLDMIAMLRRKGITEKINPANMDGINDALRRPSYIQPPPNTYRVSPETEVYYLLAIEDCNHFTVPNKKGLIMATGPVGYAVGLAKDQLTVPKKFQQCMKLMGFEPVK